MTGTARRLHDARRRRLLGLAPAALLAHAALARAAGAAAGAGATPGMTGGEIVIGQSLTLLGGRHLYGVETLSGVKVLFDDVNRSGGLAGRRLALRVLDDNNEPAQAEANARQLVQQGAFALFGSLEAGASAAVMHAAIELGVPLFGPMAGAPSLRRPHQPLVFPVRAEHRDEFRALIEHGRSIGLKRVALFHGDSALGREHLATVQQLAGTAGVGWAGGLAYRPDITDAQLDATVADLTRRQADLVINDGAAPIYERLIRRARAAASRVQFWGINSGSAPLAAALGPLAHGMVFSQIVPSPWSRKTALVRDYQEHYAKAVPGTPLSYGSLEGYMTARALVDALRAAGAPPSRARLLAAMQNFEADLGGLTLRWRKGEHTGCTFVDLALVGSDGRFIQ